MKSSPSTASDATTTVRVVARDTPSGVGWASIALQQGDEGHGDAEHEALDDAVADVAPDVDAALHLAPERARVDADHAARRPPSRR